MRTNNIYDPLVVKRNILAYHKRLMAAADHLKQMSELSNLEFKLSPSQERKGILGLLGNKYGNKKAAELWIGLLYRMILGSDYHGAVDGVVRTLKNKRTVNSILGNIIGYHGLATTIEKLDNSFEIHVNVGTISASSLPSFLTYCADINNKLPDETHVDLVATEFLEKCTGGNYGESIRSLSQGMLNDKGTAMLLDCGINLEAKLMGSTIFFMFSFNVTKDEAQHLTNKKWITIRGVDLFPIFNTWCNNALGITAVSPTSGFAITKIARSLPKDPKVMSIKANEVGLSCAPDGRPRYIPVECDNTEEYEDVLVQLGSSVSPDRFQMVDLANPETMRVALPANKPVLVDWVNHKFSYTDTGGKLKLRNMTNYRKADSSHINQWLKSEVANKQLETVLNVASSVSDAPFTAKESDFPEGSFPVQMKGPNDFSGYLHYMAQELQAEGIKMTWGDIAINSEYKYLRPLGKYLANVYKSVKDEVEVLYTKYSVEHITSIFPWIIIAAKYSPRLGEIRAEASTLNRAAIDQSGSLGYKPPATQMWNGDLGLQPHQRRIADFLKDSPRFAILPVPAGGGKTPTIIHDVLSNIEKGIGAPYLIMCPSHLVAQYVKEINFFTKGRLNVIPLKTKVFNTHGTKRLSDMINRAPRNTVVVADYDVIKLRGVSVCYGAENVNIFPVAEILKQFSFGYVALDECHYVKNASARTTAVLGVIADIPMKRLASGTMAHDSPSDLASQLSMLDPTIFGTRDDFNKKFGLEVKGDRVITWRPGYVSNYLADLKEHIVVAGAKRKEWAALLPPSEETIEGVSMTQAQRSVYESILAETLENIRNDPKLVEALEKQKKKESQAVDAEGNPIDPEGDEEVEIDLAGRLNPYIARLEQFICAPDKDVIGSEILSGADRISPKMALVNKYIDEHISNNRPGKILIFTNYTASAEHIYENILPKYRKNTIHYLASEKVAAGTAFEKDPSKLIMVGVEQSMNTGLNLQHASMLIRVEQVWNPGTLEQGNSRINRPSLKVQDKRDTIYYRWIVCNKSIDVTKMSRLTGKLVDVAKFENPNTAYSEIDDLPIMSMTLDTIATDNDWEGTLQDYAKAYSQLRQIQEREYQDFREEFKNKYGKNGMFFLGDAGVPKDAAYLENAPWVEGLEIAGENELNLIRVDQYFRQAETDSDDDDSSSGSNEASEELKILAKKLIGRVAFTELGQGKISGMGFVKGAPRPKVTIKDKARGTVKYTVRSSKCFIFDDSAKQIKDVAKAISEIVGLPKQMASELPCPDKYVKSVKAPKEVIKEAVTKKEKIKETKVRKKREEIAQLTTKINMLSTNGFLGLRVNIEKASTDLIEALQGLGFRPDTRTYRARIKYAKHLEGQINLWADKGFKFTKQFPGVEDALMDMMTLLKTKKERDRLFWKFIKSNELINFYRKETRPTKGAKEIKIYPIIEDGKAYLAMPVSGSPGSTAARMKKAPNIIWEKSPKTLSWYCLKRTDIKAKIKSLGKSGISITNKESLQKVYDSLKKSPTRKMSDGNEIDV